MQVKEAVQEYSFAILNISVRTQGFYMQKLKMFATWCEREPLALEDITPKHVSRYIDHRRKQGKLGMDGKPTGKPLASYTLRGDARAIKVFLHWCSQDTDLEKLVSERAVGRITIPKVQEKIIETFTTPQIQALLAACDENSNKALAERDRTILMMLMDTGIRASELIGLTLNHVHIDNPHDPYIRVLGKGDKWREVGIGSETVKTLRRYIFHQRKGCDGPVFIARYQEQPLTVNGLDQLVRRLGQQVHIEGVRCSPHTFRHTFAVRYLEAGGDVYRLSRLMGHTEMRVTELYLKAVKQREARMAGISVMDNVAREKSGRKNATNLKVVKSQKPLDRFSVMDNL